MRGNAIKSLALSLGRNFSADINEKKNGLLQIQFERPYKQWFKSTYTRLSKQQTDK